MGKNSHWQIEDKNNELMKIWKKRVTANLLLVLEFIGDHTLAEMSKPATGRWYTFYNHNTGFMETYQASAPGQYPTVKTGDLKKELKKKTNFKVEWSGYKVDAYIGVDNPDVAKYAIDVLDAGLRPWRNRALLECGPTIQQILGEKLLGEVSSELLKVAWKNRWT